MAVSASITDFGWEVQNGIPVPVLATGDPAPPELVDVILRYQCRAEVSSMSYSCHREHLTCTSCRGVGECYNPYTQKTATTQAAGRDEAEEQVYDDVVYAEEHSEEAEE